MANPFYFTEKLVYRSPALAFIEQIPESVIEHLLNDNRFLEAIYIASPVLYKQCIKLRDGKITDNKAIAKLHNSIVKYYQRMYSRCTPFGLFAGCGVDSWHNTESTEAVKKANESGNTRQTRLDMYYLCKLSFHLSGIKAIRNKIRWYPNTSLYTIAGSYRYIEYEHIKDKRAYKISEVAYSKPLETVLENSTKGMLAGDLVAVVQMIGYSDIECTSFIEQLIESQILVSDLEPAVTGEEPLQYLIALLEKIADGEKEVTEILATLKNVQQLLLQIDTDCDGAIDLYQSVMKQLDVLQVPYDESKLFQVDLYHNKAVTEIKPEWKQELMNAFGFLSGLSSHRSNTNLDDFINKFKDRFEEQWMPLNEVLDADMGIGYANDISHGYSQLIEGLLLPSPKQESITLQWDSKEEWLLQKLIAASANKLYEVPITGEDINRFPANWEKLPPSMSMMFSPVEQNRIILDNITGTSAVNLLGRFAGGLPAIHQLVNEITGAEQSNNPDAVFAEIAHLPENRTGNILLRPKLRKLEIPFLARPATERYLGEEQCNVVSLNDIWIAIKQGEILLYSKKIKQYIIPKLGTAHNYSLSTLPVYRFLCDLQGQNLRSGIRFSWGNLKQLFTFLPRVVLGNTILCEATWQFKKTDIEALTNCDEANLMSTVQIFFNKWQMPALVMLSDGDNELLVDIKSYHSIKAFVSTIKGRTSIIVKEYLKPSHLQNGTSGITTQYIAPVINSTKVIKAMNNPFFPQEHKEEALQRSFIPGSEWLYIKIYCGVAMADKVLLDAIYPMMLELLKGKYIKKWFFIRYNDPAPHLRVRLQITDTEYISYVTKSCNHYFEKLQKNKTVNKVYFATYEREIERYGKATMELSESVFHLNSAAILQLLSYLPNDEIKLLWGIQYTDMLLNAFRFTDIQKHTLLKHLSKSFANEFKADKLLLQQLSNRYRQVKPQIHNMLTKGFDIDFNQNYSKQDILLAHREQLYRTVEEIYNIQPDAEKESNIKDLISSFIHMHFNRLFITRQRVHEMLVYDYLHQYYESNLAIINQATAFKGVLSV
jgi:lantibiotic biosynthesis protein